MKIYQADRRRWDRLVWVKSDSQEYLLSARESQKIRNHSPDGFEWGYAGSGPAQLALAILLDCFRDRVLAERLYQDFKDQFLVQADRDWFGIHEACIRHWVDDHPMMKELKPQAGI